MKLTFLYMFTVCIILKTPCSKYFVHGVLNIMKTVSTKITLFGDDEPKKNNYSQEDIGR